MASATWFLDIPNASLLTMNANWLDRAGVSVPSASSNQITRSLSDNAMLSGTKDHLALPMIEIDDSASFNGDGIVLSARSPLVNAATFMGIDVNGAAPGDYTGTAPDIAGWESPW
jgi:hypothetical protein